MDNKNLEDHWARIQQQTALLMEQIAHSDAEDLCALMQQRQLELEAFFQEMEYTPGKLDDIEQRIEELLECDASLLDSCRQQQQSLLQQSSSAAHSRKSIIAYEDQAESGR